MSGPSGVEGRTKCERMEATISRVVEPETAEEGRRGRRTAVPKGTAVATVLPSDLMKAGHLMMTNKTFTIVAAGLLITALAGQAEAQGRGRGNGKSKARAPQAAQGASVAVVFGDRDRVTVRNYFAAHKIAPQSLPPGIAKNVARGKPLPPGIAKRAVPADLVVLLPRREPNVTFYLVGDRVVALRAGIVIDVLIDIFR